jgi:formylglycine-generating enzyme required for sulfatase activity/serine/threonine protein kinase
MAPSASAAVLDTLRELPLLDAAQLQEVTDHLHAQCATPADLVKELVRRGWLTPFQRDCLLQDRARELVLGPYLLLARLGRGGMGDVYKARHLILNRLVALKVARKDLKKDATDERRFLREIQATAQLAHPNIVTAYDAARIDGAYIFAMEYVEGIDLARLLRAYGTLPVAHSCEYVRQAALGLQHAHERGLVHRDIKPANMLLTADGRLVKVSDLGLVRLGEEEGQLTSPGLVIGTPDYLAPEQVTNSRAVDIRADLYSLGCTLYHFLTGRPPFPEGTAMEKLFKHVEQQPTPVEELRPDVPPGVAEVVRRLLAKKPDDRYQAPIELAQALEPFCSPLGDLPAPTRPGAALPPLDVVVPFSSCADQPTVRARPATPPDAAADVGGETGPYLGVAPRLEPEEGLAPDAPKEATAPPPPAAGGVNGALLPVEEPAPEGQIVSTQLPVLPDDPPQPPPADAAPVPPPQPAPVEPAPTPPQPAPAAAPPPPAPDPSPRRRLLSRRTILVATAALAIVGAGVKLWRTWAVGQAATRPPVKNVLGMELIYVPAGAFTMGSPPDEPGRRDDEGPTHRVVISRPFYLAANETTVAQFRAFADATHYLTQAEKDGKGALRWDPAKGAWEQDPACTWRKPGWAQKDDEPVVCVSRYDAAAFCLWLNAKEGRFYRPPTEAEWEYACRAGTTTAFATGTDLTPAQAQFGSSGPARVRSLPANAWGLFDLHGNVWEWCADFYTPTFYRDGPATDPLCTKQGDLGVLRGGSWHSSAAGCRCASRLAVPLGNRRTDTGFRVLLESGVR